MFVRIGKIVKVESIFISDCAILDALPVYFPVFPLATSIPTNECLANALENKIGTKRRERKGIIRIMRERKREREKDG